ncbi:hypothetical protein JL720_14431 [Aureococcus anophagefferens]|nr:hypothetical protein JL720_14431 [Aureococcus anophagefferens]
MLLGSHRRGLAAPAPRAVAPTAPPPMAETPPKVWNRLALAALLFMCFAVSHLIATHMKSMITVAPVSVQADLKNRETKSTWDTHIPRVNISAALAARLEEIRGAARRATREIPGEEACAAATARPAARRSSMDGRRRLDDRGRTRWRLVPLGGVGATCILLRADLVREGLSFPSFALNHAIESEGIAQMALKMGARVYGRTDVAIKHA